MGFLGSWHRAIHFAAAAGLLVLGLARLAASQPNNAYEGPPILEASGLVPAALLSGPHHRVDEAVNTVEFMNHFTIRSDFGEFAATSERMLRVRVQEVQAIAQLQELSRTDAFAGALKGGAVATVDTVTAVVTNPVETAKGLPSGVGRAARGLYYKGRKLAHKTEGTIDGQLQEPEAAEPEAGATGTGTGEQESTAAQAKDGATGAAKKYSGYDAAKRALAQGLEVDPYSTNQVLQRELTRLAQAAFAGNLGFKAVLPSSSVLGSVRRAHQLVWETPPSELERLNDKALAGMGLEKSLRLEFFAARSFSPTTQTLLVQALERMEQTANRQALIELAATLELEEDAWLLTTAARVLAHYHERVRPLTRLVLVGNDEVGHLPAGITGGVRAIVPVPFDHVSWVPSLDVRGPVYEFEERELWVVGHVSPRAERELKVRGFVVHQQVAELLESQQPAGR